MGGYIPSNIWQGGDGQCNHPPQYCERLTIFCLILTNIQTKINRFCSNNSWFLMILAKILPKISPKMQNFGQSGPKNCVFYPSPALSLHLKVFTKLRHSVFKIQKSSSFWGGHIPPHTHPCARKRAIGADAPPNYPPPPMFKTDLRPWCRVANYLGQRISMVKFLKLWVGSVSLGIMMGFAILSSKVIQM